MLYPLSYEGGPAPANGTMPAGTERAQRTACVSWRRPTRLAASWS